MRHILAAAVIAAALASPALAQQQPSPDVPLLQKALSAMQQQRDRAMNEQVNALAQASLLSDEVARLKAENEELKKKLAPEPPKKK